MSASIDQPEALLAHGLKTMGIDLDQPRQQLLLDFLAMLERWNRTYNLTAVGGISAMVSRHLLDSLAVLPWLEGQRIADLGSGAGLPGIPLAIAAPQRHFVLIDSNGKKVRFMRQVRRELGLTNIEPVQARIESVSLQPSPDELVVRAVADLAELVDLSRRWLDRGARLLAMKGPMADHELEALSDQWTARRVELKVPGVDGPRCLVVVSHHADDTDRRGVHA